MKSRTEAAVGVCALFGAKRAIPFPFGARSDTVLVGRTCSATMLQGNQVQVTWTPATRPRASPPPATHRRRPSGTGLGSGRGPKKL